ncbi:MAG TPA: hypothetical protein VFB06_11150 [Streptosporangiaceae bacterium]|nr:hypothetical protein [Streptosporangiaceae bacterium]
MTARAVSRGEAAADDLEWLARFRETHDDVVVLAKAQCPVAYPLSGGRPVRARDLHELRGELDARYPGEAAQ